MRMMILTDMNNRQIAINPSDISFMEAQNRADKLATAIYQRGNRDWPMCWVQETVREASIEWMQALHHKLIGE